MRPINRIQPALPVEAYKTYGIVAPLTTHWRVATCEEVDCPAQQLGWTTTVDETAELGQRQAYYIRHEAKRSFKESRRPDGMTDFAFSAGQRCFQQHKKRLEREELFLARGGDWRGATSPTAQYDRVDQWVDDFAAHQETIADVQRRG